MKYYYLLISLFLIIPLSACSQSEKVYICRSAASYAYHNKMCQGLKKCSHKVETVTVNTAIKEGYKKACGYCYKKRIVATTLRKAPLN